MTEHVHTWGPVEEAPFTGNPHIKCTDPDCRVVSLDLEDANTEAFAE